MSLTSGTRVGPYEITGKIGAGGMGEVYRAKDTRLGRDVAIKVLPASFAADADRLRRFELEARATGMLNHPNILAVYDVGTHQGAPYLVTELLEGATLRDELPVPRRKALDYARQIAAGLAAAHAKGVTHRDLKPDNLFITKEGRVKILDFGLAKVNEPILDSEATAAGATTPGVAMGTVGYMSPEQARGTPADHRSDIFSFGVILYEMLSGTRAFQRDSAMDTLSAILKEDPPPLEDIAMERIVRRCLEKTPEQRYQSASDLGFSLEALSGTGSVMTMAAAPAAAPVKKRTSPLVAIAALVLGLLAGAATGFWWHAKRDAAAPVWQGERLTGSGIVYGPRISPDGRTLAFISIEGMQSQVAVMHPGSANWTVLTHQKGRGEIDYLSWSSDGTKVYFSRRTGIYSVPALGGDERLIVEQAGVPEVLPDGSMLLLRLSPQRTAQLHHFWPDSGRDEALNAELVPRFRVFPDGKEAVFVGRPYGDSKADYALVAFDLASQKFRPLTTGKYQFYAGAIALTPDGKGVLTTTLAGDLVQITEFSRDGRSPGRAITTLSNPVWFMDAGSDGTIYADQIARPFDVLRFPVSGGIPERVAETPEGGSPIPLPDGRIVFSAGLTRPTIMITQPGKSPVPLIETDEGTTTPIALAGRDLVALHIYKQGDYKNRVVALVSTTDGRIVKRVESTRGIGMNAMAVSPDGKTIYYQSNGDLFAVPIDGGEPKKLGVGDQVAAHPNGKDLIATRTDKDGVHMYRIPVGGGSEERIPFQTDLVLNASLSPLAVRADGKIAITVLRPDSWWDEGAILDPVTGKVEKLNVPYSGDGFAPAWTADGRLVESGQLIEGSLWRFRTKPH